jgi:hypothetical protein
MLAVMIGNRPPAANPFAPEFSEFNVLNFPDPLLAFLTATESNTVARQ